MRGNSPPAPFMVIAHRGARAYAPENTLPAFAKALEMGARMFELDVHLTRDGIPVVVHDDTLVRCSDVKNKFPGREPYFVSDFTMDEIKTLDAGSWFVAELSKPPHLRQGFLQSLTQEEQSKFISAEELEYYRSGRVTHPTLEETLLWAKEHGLFVNVEIKNLPRFYPEITPKVVSIVKKTEMTSRVLVSCFDHCQVALCKTVSPEIATAALCSDRLSQPGNYCADMLHADAYNPDRESLIVGPHSLTCEKTPSVMDPAIQNAREKKLGINVWTVNDPRQMKILIQAGVTGIFTDYPNRLFAVLKSAENR